MKHIKLSVKLPLLEIIRGFAPQENWDGLFLDLSGGVVFPQSFPVRFCQFHGLVGGNASCRVTHMPCMIYLDGNNFFPAAKQRRSNFAAQAMQSASNFGST